MKKETKLAISITTVLPKAENKKEVEDGEIEEIAYGDGDFKEPEGIEKNLENKNICENGNLDNSENEKSKEKDKNRKKEKTERKRKRSHSSSDRRGRRTR